MTEENMGASPNGVGLSSASPIEPVPVSPVPASIPCAGEIYRSEEYAMTLIDTGRDSDGAPIAEMWAFASEDDGVEGYGWLEVRVHEIVPSEHSGTLAVYYRQWFAPNGEPAWGTRPKRTVGSFGSLKSLIRRRKMTAKAIEARQGGNAEGGAVHESAVPAGHSPEPSTPSSTTKEAGE